jgi:hypothetical protein
MPTSAAFKSALYTALWTFIALFGLALGHWLIDLTNWAADTHHAVIFPDPGVLVKAAVAAVGAAGAGLVSFVVRFVQGRLGVGSVPVYVKAPKSS